MEISLKLRKTRKKKRSVMLMVKRRKMNRIGISRKMAKKKN